ncbi:MAG: hypothetical protein ACTSQJ_12970 [Promethearchaeota archaeon]
MKRDFRSFAQLKLFLGYYYFIRTHKELRVKSYKGKKKWMERTPMMAAVK